MTTQNTLLDPRDPSADQGPALLPAVDVVEDASGITLYADLPGVSKEQLNLRIDGDRLDIEGAFSLAGDQNLKPLHAEVRRRRYHRSFTLSKELDAARVSAEIAHGTLRVRIPKASHAQARRVEVRAA